MYAIKARVAEPGSRLLVFDEQKTMYGGRRIAPGDTVLVFASENEGGSGLFTMGTVVVAGAVPRKPGIARQTPRVSIVVRREALAARRLERAELRPWSDWDDGRPETELNFKLYRQATDKIVGFSAEAAGFLREHFLSDGPAPCGGAARLHQSRPPEEELS